MTAIFNARTGKTILYAPRFLALRICMFLDRVTGEFHDYECKYVRVLTKNGIETRRA